MSEPKFTPGPWIFGTKGDWTISSAVHSGSLMGNTTYYPWVPENKADWHLIAAAPDLYEALKDFAEAWDKEESIEGLALAYINAEAALAKARGESHE